jgi:hypothetical protein
MSTHHAITTVEGSNVLADSAARIKAEHEAAAAAMRHGAEHNVAFACFARSCRRFVWCAVVMTT